MFLSFLSDFEAALEQNPVFILLQFQTIIEDLICRVWKACGLEPPPTPFPRMPYEEVTFRIELALILGACLECSRIFCQRQPIAIIFISHHFYYYNFQTIWDSVFDGGGAMYVSRPLEKEVDLAGCFSGELQVIINKKDIMII